jgi:hypothetical protein
VSQDDGPGEREGHERVDARRERVGLTKLLSTARRGRAGRRAHQHVQ